MDLQRKQNFEDLYEYNQREVWRLVYARLNNADDAQDIVQEVFCRLWNQWSDGEVVFNPRAWLLRVARNLVEDWVKNSFRRNGTQSSAIIDEIRSREPLPQESLARGEVLRKILEALDELPDDYRDVWTRHHIGQQTRDEIGLVTGRSPASVKAILARANKLLRRILNCLRRNASLRAASGVATSAPSN